VLVRESQVEDVLATYPHLTQQLLGVSNELSLLARQMSLPSGKLDLLFASGNRLLLLELKVEDFREEFIKQVVNYRDDLMVLQSKNMLLQGNIDAFLVCPAFPNGTDGLCKQSSVIPIVYSPAEVLEAFFSQIEITSPFITMKPMDSGLWNIHLINRVVYALLDTPVKDLPARTGLSERSVGNHLRFAEQLCLAQKVQGSFHLSNLGKQYVLSQDPSSPFQVVAEGQAKLLRDFIVRDPFVTPTIFGIYLMVETVFSLARNTYPVPLSLVIPYFRDACGKRFIWQTETSSYHGTRMYSNYAVELGLLGKMGDKLLLTPSGLQFILLLQLHKGIKIVDALQKG